MDRKKFIGKTSIAGFLLSGLGKDNSIIVAKKKDNILDKPPFIDFELNEVTITSLQDKMQSGSLTSESICNLYLKRIAEIDHSGVKLNSIIELNPDALSIARALDLERKQGKVRGLLHGIPILIKDNINTADKMMTTAGAEAMIGNHPQKDAFIVSQLRKAGAVILGKTNLSEWANFRSTLSTSGWSSRGKQTKSPYVLDRNPSGSSAGTGSSIAANLCTLGIGTETNGSIVSPASINGLVGIKPTVGLWSRNGIIPISITQDTAGPMARSVTDAAILLGALTGVDVGDTKTMESLDNFKINYLSYLQLDGLQGKRIGIEKSHLKGNEVIVGVFQKAIQILKDLGATIVEVDIDKALEKTNRSEFIILQYEFKDGLNKYLQQNSGPMKNLQAVIEYNKVHKDSAMPYFQQETLLSSEAMGDLKSPAYLEALKLIQSSKEILLDLMKKDNLDALSGITNGLACCIDLVNGDYDTGYSISTPAAISGFPHITVPMGFINELPIGLSFFSGPYQEPLLLGMAYAYEQKTKNRTVPKFFERIGY